MSTENYPIRTLALHEFPPFLAEIADPPTMLYARGTLAPESNKVLAVVGSRAYSQYGKEVVRTLVAGLAGYPITIVSGLALGIDALAHEAALEQKLNTIAVPGSGIEGSVLYPSANRRLALRILEAGGGLLSEFEPLFRATAWSLPQRNRIMAGMAHAVLIIEAREKSGTLITARLAMEYNRDVMTVPGSIFAAGSAGPHRLIRDGAVPVTSSEDILEVLHVRPREARAQETITADAYELALLKLLEAPRAKDELIRLSGRPAHETSIVITMLELKGYIKEHNGVIMRVISL